MERYYLSKCIALVIFGWASLGCAVPIFGGEPGANGLMEPIVESQMISAYLLGSIKPNLEHAQCISQELRIIRDSKANYNFPSPRGKFRHSYQWSELIVGLTRSAANDVKKNGGLLWNGVNLRFGIEVEGCRWLNDGASCILRFKGVVNPAVLIAKYEALPGVGYASLNSFVFSSWGPGISGMYPLENNGQRSYVFVQTHEKNGRTRYTEYWYFIVERGAVVVVRYWNTKEIENSPDWWPKVQEALEYYRAKNEGIKR